MTGSALSARWVGRVLVVGAVDEVARDTPLASRLPAETGRTTVLAVGDDLLDWEQLATPLAAHASEVGPSVLLVPSPTVTPPPITSACRLADTLDVEVVAPDGQLLPYQDGALFVLGTGASWWVIAPGTSAYPIGPQHPTPWWSEHLPGTVTGGVNVPAGLWLPGPERRATAVPDDRILAVPRHDALLTVVVGAPDQPAVGRDALLSAVADLPVPVRERLLVAAYGPAQLEAARLLAGALGVYVYATDGLPAYGSGGEIVVIGVGPDGRSGSHQLVRTWVHPPNGYPCVAEWNGLADLPEMAPGVASLTESISVEAVRAGLWVRAADVPPAAHVPCGLPPDPDHFLVVVDPPAVPPPTQLFAEVRRLLALLPEEHRRSLRIVVPRDTDGLAQEAACGAAVTLTGQNPLLLDAEGRLSSVASAQAAGAASTLVTTAELQTPPARPAPGFPAATTPPALSEGRPTVTATEEGLEAALPPARIRPYQRSTAQDRRRLRDALGSRYDVHARAVARLLAHHPGLRVLAADDEPEALMTDLVAVRAFLLGDRSSVVAALRSTSEVGDPAFLVCLASGIRRLPCHQGVVYRSASTDLAAQVYPAGRSFLEPTFLEASITRARPRPDTTDLIIWSTAGRRIGGIADGLPDDRVVFPAWSRFVVLGTRPATDGVPAQVLLRDLPAEMNSVGTPTNRRIRQRLDAMTAARDAVSPRVVTHFGWTARGDLPGCDAAGRPYRSEQSTLV
ncbi:hypothetical protein QTQ03_18495 [Micromonospora sp. WMMA1363]|uniref:hypothetical protein n=1 Tax=Micromonospora sp. WMMA1363 TaxID=3053985 RepID=UPI00259CCBF0|nr:hypothetical protein [Micromonospora sp. WMMA1363]MDM4721487.1 hypothetical protein [Micromonospora sp. WMMA1363]